MCKLVSVAALPWPVYPSSFSYILTQMKFYFYFIKISTRILYCHSMLSEYRAFSMFVVCFLFYCVNNVQWCDKLLHTLSGNCYIWGGKDVVCKPLSDERKDLKKGSNPSSSSVLWWWWWWLWCYEGIIVLLDVWYIHCGKIVLMEGGPLTEQCQCCQRFSREKG